VTLATLAGCELQEIVVSTPEDLVVAEVYLQAGSFGNRGIAYLHRSSNAGSAQVPDATITLIAPGGVRYSFSPFQLDGCFLGTIPTRIEGSCYLLEPQGRQALRAGATFEVEVALADGGELKGRTTIPGNFRVTRPRSTEGPVCVLPPNTRLQVEWTPSDGTWAYIAETEIFGLPALLAPQGITLKEDPLVLLGLSISRSDTTIVFPSEFGVFDRADLDRDLLASLQGGLPDGASASIVITAGDRNYVNWVRGGGFNPSGQVRLPSLAGTGGTGVFGSQIVRRFLLEVVADPPAGAPRCSGALSGP
jgi:hypothetical protein